MSDHTSGPWTVEYQTPENQMGRDIFVVAVRERDSWIAKIAGHGSATENAKLIAAAPEILDALRDLLAWANLDHSTNSKTVALRDKCEFAVKNAIGESK